MAIVLFLSLVNSTFTCAEQIGKGKLQNVAETLKASRKKIEKEKQNFLML
jgi:hypothetical protein